MALSSWSTKALEDVACPSPQWFQLYVYKDRDVTLDLIRRAERAGYSALGTGLCLIIWFNYLYSHICRNVAITVDAPILGRREVAPARPPHTHTSHRIAINNTYLTFGYRRIFAMVSLCQLTSQWEIFLRVGVYFPVGRRL